MCVVAPFFNIPFLMVFINTVSHGIIDMTIWRGFKRFRGPFSDEYIEKNEYAKDYWFYTTIAIDQTIRLCILFWIFKGAMTNG